MTTTTPTVLTNKESGADTQLYSSSNSSITGPCNIDESYKYIFLPICYCFTFVFSITLNFVILYRSFRRTKRWNASLIYMVNLATTDFMYGLSLPFLVASYVMRDDWVFGDFMCRLVRFLFYFNLYCSIFFLTCISVHRYLGICHPMKTITLESKRAVKGTCVLVWIAVFVLTCPIFRFAQTQYLPRQGILGAVVNGESTREEMFNNCWDDAIDKEFHDYIPYGITLHFLGFFLPFSIIAWCYSRVVLTIFRTLHSQPPSQRARSGTGCESVSGIRGEGMSIILGAHSPYVNRRRKSIKTIITITLLFALCFFPFHVTRTIFLLLKLTSRVQCHTMSMVSICYKITRPLASFNAWLNALLYFLTKEKHGSCCQKPEHAQHGVLWPLKMLGKGEEEENEADDKGNHKENGTKTETDTYRGLT
ncbi:P2Y purinoceptor 3 [Misgurnus anguillicaudatus]|uniref:P2Y purinoceptor 3 n=1 Tax=Misgurnus anguillicaudatus TaxID=75329 RepID=UPI002435DFB3|nr:P2Y purinoceptor 3 [Misgurnus anguillicaudatus]XP_055056844.1 P2Y purinoceptor 3 [Misgurnus anguillicaudatus]XP_055056853.1 P2Y purinoceptor 3 [Misgurnus anguillicaudatus]XP_055056863.1 P2Y purinoceptor 3 [Misgurnus anguillicaudatus]XP_055056871.1 P2Y purinoceptor 3 [Misgurnus anguillicaudatus]